MDPRILDVITLYVPVVIAVLSAINMATQHYTKFNGILRVIMAVIENLSVLASKNTGKTLKPPMVSIPPDPCLDRMASVKKQLEEMAKKRVR
jgi:hypothetical protein